MKPMDVFAGLKGILGDDTTGESKMFIELIKGLTLHSSRSFGAIGLPMDKLDAVSQSVIRNNKI